MQVLAAVEDYPSWASLISAAELIERDCVRLKAHVLGLPLEMICRLEVAENRAVLTRIPYDAEDNERYVAAWTVRPAEVELHVEAELDAPSAASFIRSRIERKLTDDLLEDFARRV